MKKLLAILSFALLPLAAHADNINGQFICEITYSDGSEATSVIVVEGDKLKKKRLGFDDTWYRNYKLVYIGQFNEFKTFVGQWDDILTITFNDAIDTSYVKAGYHLNIIDTSVGWSPKRRMRYGKCDKV